MGKMPPVDFVVTADFIMSHLWVGGRLYREGLQVFIHPDCGPFHWQDIPVPVELLKQLIRTKQVERYYKRKANKIYYKRRERW